MPSIPILLSAGETSGDMYAASLAKALQARLDVQICGMGGPQMREAGVEIITDYSEVAVVGITEIVKHLPSLRRAMERMVVESGETKAGAGDLDGFPGVSSAAGTQTAAAGDSQRVLHLPAILGVAGMARQINPAAIRESSVYFPV